MEILHPGSFVFSTGTLEAGFFFWRFLGFSFITLTTLGYGNVSPASEQGDALAGLEAVIGQFYVAVVIARLVALYTVDTAPSDADETEAATGVEK